MRRFWAVALLSALFLMTAAVAPADAVENVAACGCGAVVPAPGTTAEVTGESAIVSLQGGVETIVLSLGVNSTLPGVGLVVPTPTPASVVPGDAALFDALDAQLEPAPRYVDDWWGNLAQPASAEPTVLSRVQVGDYEATSLAASDSAGLNAWLSAHGYALPPETAALLQGYVAKNWYFTAIKLANDAGGSGAGIDGRVDPIQISFPSETMVYPLGLAKSALTEQSLRLSVIGGTRADLVQAGSPSTPLNAAEKVVWAGPVTEEALLPLGGYLTVVDLTFDSPATQIIEDIGIVAAPNDDVVAPTTLVVRPVTLLGFPLGTLLVVWAGLGLLAAVAAVVARSRLR
ncbi:hypothetical protein HD599_001034 [Conyzicola lurida]|uniref:DUF2330 domain-containing protein n=1 Tax=Conyzicola lurida TaxID=1172621 RepID=A0A841ALV6_9MICO|nr:hypothetical protein [Conyzicola lurida]